jgi:hypothetical protein
MNCEHVKELLSAYLDNKLAPDELADVTGHLQQCAQCRPILADFRHNDALLRQLPRVGPSPELRDKIFSSPEYLELTGTTVTNNWISNEWTRPTPTINRESTTEDHTRHDTPGRPHLVALPGGRTPSLNRGMVQRPGRGQTPPLRRQFRSPFPVHRRRLRPFSDGSKITFLRMRGATQVLRVAMAVVFLLTIGVAVLVGRNLLMQQASRATLNGAIPPPAGLEQGPFPVGMRFVFLRDGVLWSSPADGSTSPERITPTNVTVAANWVVSPALPGRSAGDMLAYIDLEHAQVHTIRSDGQSDTIASQPLLKTGVAPSTIWDTDTGAAILNGLAWSKNGTMLAFVGDPNGTGHTNLYILSMNTGTVEMVPLSGTGSASHPAWSPDGVRLAFEFTSSNTVSVMDYNTQNHGLLTISDTVRTSTNPADTVQTLDWSPNIDMPTITWSAGVTEHIHSIWIRRVGVGDSEMPELLASGDYAQASYSASGHGDVGSWLLVTSIAGPAGDIWYVDATATGRVVALTTGKHVGSAWWSPNGFQVDYLDSISTGLGTLHIVNTATGIDTLIVAGVVDEPAPAWSEDSQELAYSTGTQTIVINPSKKMQTLNLRGPASTLTWSTGSNDQLIVAISDVHQGIYLVDVAHNTSHQIDTQGVNSSILWTEVP